MVNCRKGYALELWHDTKSHSEMPTPKHTLNKCLDLFYSFVYLQERDRHK